MNINVRVSGSRRHSDGLARILIEAEELGTTVELDLPFKELSDRLNAADALTLDFLIIAGICYTADKIVERKTAPDNWTREFNIEFPVSSTKAWLLVLSQLQIALGFLTGDIWKFSIRAVETTFFRKPRKPTRRRSEPQLIAADKVCLFSGGLDSLIGAIDLLQNNRTERIVLLGHYDMVGPKSQQQNLFPHLKSQYGDRVTLLQNRLSQKPLAAPELTLRSRSIVFMALALYVARSLGPSIPIYAPENGLIAINVPLTPSRTGSCSTRTMHPFFLESLGSVFKGLGFQNEIANPLALKTKGECITTCAEQLLLKSCVGLSVSCSHPTRKQNWHRKSAKNCGYCVPCLVRRAALYNAAWDDGTDYGIDVLTEKIPDDADTGNDFRAVRSFLDERKTLADLILEIRAVAPIDDADEYAAMAMRGFDELRRLISTA
jgi:7-cyano-7-deazaguanine synthase in queuosine biosynthesis